GIPNFKETRIAMLRAETVKELFSILDYIRGNYGMNS
ncbi:tRNA dihydrouridine synthase DusB, partial [Phocaeicola vulgatus]|nr:tRNA dihydrouridine synthase DusB [Phocaeicola vulgatus]